MRTRFRTLDADMRNRRGHPSEVVHHVGNGAGRAVVLEPQFCEEPQLGIRHSGPARSRPRECFEGPAHRSELLITVDAPSLGSVLLREVFSDRVDQTGGRDAPQHPGRQSPCRDRREHPLSKMPAALLVVGPLVRSVSTALGTHVDRRELDTDFREHEGLAL